MPSTRTNGNASELSIRIVIDNPPSGVLYCLQRSSRSDCISHVRSDVGDISFDLSIRVKHGGDEPDFLGPFVRGGCGGRYVAVLIGTLAGDADSCWTRGAKFWLRDISWSLVDEVLSRQSAVLEGRFAGTAKSGGPACATAHFINEGWCVKG